MKPASEVGTATPAPAPEASPPLSLYIHVPWCVRKCPYCDFNSHTAPDALPIDDYVRALLADLDFDLAANAGESRPIHSIFFGGGTPSLMPGGAIARILEGVAARLTLEPGCEITLEANPGTVEHDAFAAYRVAGVNRLSLGVQTFDDAALARLGRIHDSVQAARAIEAAAIAGFDNFNLDLMFALPEQDVDAALRDIERALAFTPAHLSHYQLTIEPNTVFAAKPPTLPEHDAAWLMQEECQQLLTNAGYVQYEVSAWSRPGCACRHNLNYWGYGDYLGIGAGAHAKQSTAGLGITRQWKLKQPRAYLAAAGTPAQIGGTQRMTAVELPFDYAQNALRLFGGFELADFESRTGLAASTLGAPLSKALELELVDVHAGRVTPTERGRNFLNDLLQLFLPATSDRHAAAASEWQGIAVTERRGHELERVR